MVAVLYNYFVKLRHTNYILLLYAFHITIYDKYFAAEFFYYLLLLLFTIIYLRLYSFQYYYSNVSRIVQRTYTCYS